MIEKGEGGPERRSRAAMALVSDWRGAERFWLARWNENWKAFHLVGGHLLPGETFRNALAREMTEELGLRNLVDSIVSPEPKAHLEYTADSRSAGVATRYETELFEVWILGEARRSLDRDPSVRWLGESEILLGRCDEPDGRPVSPTMRFLLEKVGLFDYCESDMDETVI